MVLIEVSDQMTSNGWPLGLGNMSYRIRSIQQAATPQTHPCRRIPRSSSFTSYSSSNLDTESTASTFYRDPSVSLGRLIGIKAAGKEKLVVEAKMADWGGVSKSHENPRRNCVPLLRHVIGRMMTPSGRH